MTTNSRGDGMTPAQRAVALMRLAAALEDKPEPNRALRRAAARTTKRKGSPRKRG